MADKVIISKSTITDICDAVREKTNSTELIQTANIGNLIRGIETGGVDERFKQIVERTITEAYDETITSIGDYAFSYCSSLTSVDFPNVISIGNSAFQNCTSLISVDFPNVTSITHYAFQNCKSLINVDIPNATSIISYAFSNCSSLTSVNFPNVASIGHYTFQNCTSLTSVDFPNITSIGQNVFSYCEALTTLILRSTTLCTLGNISAFNNTPIATSETDGFIYVPDELVEDYKVATNWVTYASKIKPISELPTEG